jgi:beta-galactosidase
MEMSALTEATKEQMRRADQRNSGALKYWLREIPALHHSNTWIPGRVLLQLIFVLSTWHLQGASAPVSFCSDWRFVRSDSTDAQATGFDDRRWETVVLPHTARIEPLITGKAAPQWQGVCWYRKHFKLPADARDKTVWLRFEGAMNVAEIWVNGESAGKFMGGYLPYVMDISRLARIDGENVVAVRLDNRDNPLTGPKPLVDLDFNLYGGLYRKAELIIKDRLHISDPILADKVAGGGVFVTFPLVTKERATVQVRTHVENTGSAPRRFQLRSVLTNTKGDVVATVQSDVQEVPAGADRELNQEIQVTNPALWSPQSPNLYQVRSSLIDNGRTMDSELTRIGIRRIDMAADGFRINGEKMFLRGVNRHQEYPYIGNALSEDAQYRDARNIKEAGFDYVRLSHYPQSPAFFAACDELGLVVMDSIMGWQYFNKDPAFADLKYRECRQLIRRDRNHPSVILWEVSLNESDMPKPFVQQANAIAHEEYPGDQCYTCGWMKGYDVFMQARQHGNCRKVKDQPCLISEYGDWEYFAQNAGLEQDKWKDLQPAERNSRQLRDDGEVRLLQQALNFQEAHNDNRKTTAFADGVWVMFDYNRGYADEIESSGVMDIFRLPKFGYWFFKSQRDPEERAGETAAGSMVFIANYWTADSPQDVSVFSNCEEVALYLNGKMVGRNRPDTSRLSTNLRHAPFLFKVDQFQPGTLKAVGYINGREVAQCERRTPGKAATLALRFDFSGRPFAANSDDVVFCHADLQDDAGTVVPSTRIPVFFGSSAATRLVGHNPILSEAGTASILVASDIAKPSCSVYALCLVRDQDQIRILSAAASPNGGSVPQYTIRYTTDGTEPSDSSSVYSKPISSASRLRAAIFVDGQLMAGADARIEAPSTAGKAGSMQTAQR